LKNEHPARYDFKRQEDALMFLSTISCAQLLGWRATY